MKEDRFTVQLNGPELFRIHPKETADFLKVQMQPPVGVGGTTDYNDLDNKPRINNVVLKNNKNLDELGIQPAGDYADQALSNLEIEELLRNFV